MNLLSAWLPITAVVGIMGVGLVAAYNFGVAAQRFDTLSVTVATQTQQIETLVLKVDRLESSIKKEALSFNK